MIFNNAVYVIIFWLAELPSGAAGFEFLHIRRKQKYNIVLLCQLHLLKREQLTVSDFKSETARSSDLSVNIVGILGSVLSLLKCGREHSVIVTSACGNQTHSHAPQHYRHKELCHVSLCVHVAQMRSDHVIW